MTAACMRRCSAPPTVEIGGMIFQWLHWPGNPEKAVQDVQKTLQRYGDPKAVEEDINFVQVTHLLALDQQPFSQGEEWLLSGMVADAWRGWLHVQYPDRRFVVRLRGPEETQEDSVGITFYQDR